MWGLRAGRIIERFRLPVALVVAAIAYGTVGYWLLDRGSPLDALYRTVLTLSTVGTNEPSPPGSNTKLFTISLILFGVAALFTAIGVGTEVLVSGEFGRWARWRRMTTRLARVDGHIVVCAYGRVGRAVVEELRRNDCTVVVIEPRAELAEAMTEHGLLHLRGDPTDEAVLREAAIERASALVCAVDSDAANVYITLTARAINPALRIVARASDPGSVDKLVRAGADEVISPYHLSGRRMALVTIRPSVVDVLELLRFGPDVQLEEILVRPGSRLEGRTIAEVLATYSGISILAVKKPEAGISAAPEHTLRLVPGDLIVSIGAKDILDRMSE